MKMSPISWVAFILTVVGGLNWGLVGAFDFNLVTTIFGSVAVAERTVYILVGLSALYLVVDAVMKAKKPTFSDPQV